MNARERRIFNALLNDNAKIGFIRGLVEKERIWREKSVCLVKETYFVRID
jgi:hypothetical protein